VWHLPPQPLSAEVASPLFTLFEGERVQERESKQERERERARTRDSFSFLGGCPLCGAGVPPL
jgi:hypothetical protein